MKRPKNHISWSQLLEWEKGPEASEKYISGGFQNIEMDFGDKIHKGLKNGVDDPDVNFVRVWIPEPGEREVEMEIEIAMGVKLKIGIDGLSFINGKGIMPEFSESIHIDEYKTGKTPWTQKKVDNHGQITVYDLGIYIKHGIIPNNTLWWIPTEEDEFGNIKKANGIPKAFETTRSLYDIMAMKRRLVKAHKEIGLYYKHKKNG